MRAGGGSRLIDRPNAPSCWSPINAKRDPNVTAIACRPMLHLAREADCCLCGVKGGGIAMKRLLLGGAALLALAAAIPAMAADMPLKAPILKAPVELPYNWTGFYIRRHA